MEFLGVGPTELIFILVIALLVLGPKDLAKTGETIGKWLNAIIQSDGWKALRKTSDELRRLPTQLMREDNLKKFTTPDDLMKKAEETRRDTWSGGPVARPLNAPSASAPTSQPAAVNENRIQPPEVIIASPEIADAASLPPVAKPRKTPVKKTPAVKKAVSKSVTPRKKPNA